MCTFHPNIAVIGGQGSKQNFVRDAVWVLDKGIRNRCIFNDQHLVIYADYKLLNSDFSIFLGNDWQPVKTSMPDSKIKPESRMGHSVVYDPLLRTIYLYGGSKKLKWFSDVYTLDTDEWEWKVIEVLR